MAEVEVLVPPRKSLGGTEAQGENAAVVSAVPEDVEGSVALPPPPGETPSNANEFAGLDMPSQKSSLTVKKLTRREKLLERALKPLVEKCIPDKDPRAPPEPRVPLFPGLKAKKKPELTKDEERDLKAMAKRRSSGIKFRMPKHRDEAETRRLKTEKMVEDLIKYMKRSWKVRVDPKSEERPLVYRTLNCVYTQKPDDWKDLVETREQIATQTGFFCGFDGPYIPLINLQLDTPMLVFENLPADLKITATRWLRMKAYKEELKKKRDAQLPRLQRNKIKRPSFARGRLIKDPGGVKGVDKFVKVAEEFQKLTKGDVSYAKVLVDYALKKEDEDAGLNKGFGPVRGDFQFGFRAANGTVDDPDAPQGEREQRVQTGKSERRDSITDGRKFQRDMLDLEFMISALYDLIKSMLNIKVKQMSNKLPLPPGVVIQLRSKSPEAKGKKVGLPVPPKELRKRVRKLPGIYSATTAVNLALDEMDEEDDEECVSDSEEEEDDEEEEEEEEEEEKGSKYVRAKVRGTRELQTVRDKLAAGGPIVVEDVLSLSPVRSSTRVIAEIKKVHSLNEKKKGKKGKLSAARKLEQLTEDSDHAAIRVARNAATYQKLFERHKKAKRPIWYNLHVEDFTDSTLGAKKNEKAGEPQALGEADPEEIVEQAIRRRQHMESNKRWPDEADIMTPVFPFRASKTRLSSEEQSRRNLLAKAANLEEVTSTPVRRLYRLAGVRTTDKETFQSLLDMKSAFRLTERKVRVFYENETGKFDWDTVQRFRAKLNAVVPDPVYQWTVAVMRAATKNLGKDEDEDGGLRLVDEGAVRRQSFWFKRLLEVCSEAGAARHTGCQLALQRLMKYCDIDVKSKSSMLSRLALLAVSLPTTELAARHWQSAILFLLENLFGAPPDALYEWLNYRGLPCVV